MNKMLASSKRYFGIVLIILLAACGTVPTQQPVTPSPTNRHVPPTATTSPTKMLTLTPTQMLLPKFPLEGYVMAFVKNDDLYFQDGNNLPIRLTQDGQVSSSPYAVSDDYQKVVFLRNDGNAYSINADGTQEQTIIKNIIKDRPPHILQPGIGHGIVGFIPGTHRLLFETVRCETQEFGSPCSISLFLIDTDTGDMKKLGDLGLAVQLNSGSQTVGISPDGKMVAVGTINGVDLVTMDGKIIRHAILPYKPSTDTVLFPSLFWLPDSNGLIVALPNTFYNSSAYFNFPASTIWRYTIDSNVAVQIPFDPPPMLDTFQVSPDGNWIVYGGLGDDPTVYLRNLADKRIHISGEAYQSSFLWSSDSKHFVFTDIQSTLGTITDPPTLTPICRLYDWIDLNHFTCWRAERIRMAEIGTEGVKIYDLGFDKDGESSLLIKPK